MDIKFLFDLNQFSNLNSILLGVVVYKQFSGLGFLVSKGLNFELTFNLGDSIRTLCIEVEELSSLVSLVKSNFSKDVLGCIDGSLDVPYGLDYSLETNSLFPNMPSKLYPTIASRRPIRIGRDAPGFQFSASEFDFRKIKLVAKETLANYQAIIAKTIYFDVSIYAAFILNIMQLNSLSVAYRNKNNVNSSDDCEWRINVAKEQFSNYLFSLKDAQINVPTIRVVEQEAQKLLPSCSEENNTIKQEVIAVEIPDEAYIYYDADFGYFETDVVKTDDQEKSKETVNTINTNNTEVKIMTNAPRSKAILNAIAAHEAQQAELNNTNTNTEVKTMAASKFDRSAAPITQDELIEAMMAEDNTVAAANGQEKSEEIATAESTNTNLIPNNKTMDNPKTSSRKLVSIELVVNIIAAIGGDCARKNHSVSKRTEKLNVLRNKNSKTISNVRGYGAIRTNGNDGSCFLDVNVFPETAMTVYNTSNRPVIIFHYDDNTQAIQSEANTEKFWRKVLHASDEVVIPNINPTLKVDLPASSDVLCERIDAGTIQAVSIKFTNMDKKMFSYYSTDISGRFIVHLKAAGDYDVSLLRDTVEVSDNFLNYNGEKGAVNNFAGASKTGRSGNNAVVVARPQVAAAQANLFAMPAPAEVSKAVETVAPVAVVIDTEKETLRAENAALKAEVSELKTQIAELTAGQSRMEAMLAQLVAAQAVKTEEVSIPEIIEVVAPALPVEVVETEGQQLARLEQERMNFFRSCEYDNFEATGEETLDFDQRAELNKLDEEIKTLKWLMNIPVADRAAAIEARRLEKEEAIRKSTEALANINKPGADLSGLFG